MTTREALEAAFTRATAGVPSDAIAAYGDRAEFDAFIRDLLARCSPDGIELGEAAATLVTLGITTGIEYERARMMHDTVLLFRYLDGGGK